MWQAACAGALVLSASACLPGGFFGDACGMRPVSEEPPALMFPNPPIVAAASCGALVEVNGNAVYTVGGPNEGFVVDDSQLTPFGAVTAANGALSGEVFAVDGVDPAKLLALRDPAIGGPPIPLYGTEGDEPGGAGQAFPEACAYFPTRTDSRCD
jgi:hypothetical protein